MCKRHQLQKKKQQLSLVFLALTSLLWLHCMDSSFNKSIKRHSQWLLRQQVPNQTIPQPLVSRRFLVASYEVPAHDSAYPFLYNKSFIYDNALAAITFCMIDKWDTAESLLFSLSRMIRKNGSYWFNYSLEVDWPSESDQELSMIRSGAIAWLGYAFCFYLENCPSQLKSQHASEAFLQTAQRIAAFLQKTIDRDSTSGLFGLARGGKSEINYSVSDSGTIVETYSDKTLYWVSSEHNIDVHLFFSHLAALTGDEAYTADMLLIEENMLKKLWSPHHGQFIRGIRLKNGIPDTVMSLDCASWGALFLFKTGHDSMARQCLKTIQQRYLNTIDGIRGYLPYHASPVYESPQVNALFFPHGLSTWGDFPFFWWEGNYGVALALHSGGFTKEATSLLRSWIGVLDADSAAGIAYSTRSIPYQFPLWKSVAATSWHIIVITTIMGKTLPHPFFS
ncbi:MAG: hypothetical protein JW795_04945 [Chitinivibrionales bacterium]|nr:hypothetical protein [Chitinivibrionales bacterium]